MGRLSQGIFALFSSRRPSESYISTGLERQPICASLAADPAQLAQWGEGRIIDLAWSPTGHLLAVGSSLGVDIYNAQTFEQYSRLPAAEPIRQIAFLEDGETLVGISDTALQRWQLHSDTPLPDTLITFARPIICAAFSLGGELIALDSGDAIYVHRARDGEQLYQLPTCSVGTQGSMAFSPDGRLLAVATGSVLQLWQIQNQELIGTLSDGIASASNIAFTADGSALLTTSGQEILLWSIPSSSSPQTLASNMPDIQRIALSRDGHFLAAAIEKRVHIWRIDGQWLRALQTHQVQTQILAFAPDNQTLLAASNDTLEAWSVPDGLERQHLAGYCDSVTSVACAPDGCTFAAVAGLAQVWQRKNGKDLLLHRFELQRRASRASGIAFSPNGKFLALATDAQIQIRRMQDGAQLALLEEGLAQGDALMFSKDGQRLFAVSPDAVRVWQVPDGVLLDTLHSGIPGAYAIVPAADGQSLVVAREQKIEFWSVPGGELLGDLDAMMDINGVALTPDGQLLAVASDDAMQIWQTAPTVQRYMIDAGAQRLVFDTTGERLASAKDSVIQVWNVVDGTLPCTLEGHTDCVSSMAFTPDGRKLISGSHDGTVRLWDVQV